MYPITPPILPNESLAGYLFRLATENGYPTSAWVAGDVGLHHCGTRPAQSTLVRLHELTGQPFEDFRRASSESEGNKGDLILQGHKLRYRSVNHFYSRLCPGCVVENPYHRQVWNVVEADCCPIHKVNLIWKCPECGKGLRWQRASLQHCPLGHELAVMPQDAARLDEDRLFLSKLIYEKFDGCANWNPVLPQMATDIAHLPVKELIDQVHFLKELLEPRSSGERVVANAKTAKDDLHSAALLLLDWPRRFREWIQGSLESGVTGGDGVFNQKHKNRLKSRLNHWALGESNLVLKEVRKALSERDVHSRAEWLGDGKERIGIGTAAEILVMNRAKFVRILAEGGYPTYTSLNGRLTFLNKADFDEIAQRLSRPRVPERQIRDEIGTSDFNVRLLVKAGVFGVEAAVRKGSGRNEPTYVYEEEVRAFKERVNSLFKADLNAEPVITYGGLRKSYHVQSLPFCDVITAFLDGKIRAAFGSATQLAAIRFVRSDLLEFALAREGALVKKIKKITPRKIAA